MLLELPKHDRVAATPRSNWRSYTPALPGYIWPLAVFLTVISITPIWLSKYFPSHNGPSLLLISHITLNLTSPQFDYFQYYEYHPFPVPYLLQTAVHILLLKAGLPPLVADKCWISLLVASRPWCLMYLLKQLSPGRELYGLAAFAFAYDFVLLRGYFNFYAATALTFFLIGYYVRHRQRWTWRSIAVASSVALLLYFTHGIALVYSGVLLAAYEFAASRSLANVASIIPRIYILTVPLLLAYAVYSVRYSDWAKSDIYYISVSSKIQDLFFRAGTPLSLLANALALCVFLATGLIGALALWRGHRLDRRRDEEQPSDLLKRHPIVLVFCVAVVTYFLLPRDAGGWHKADLHVAPYGLLLLLTLPPGIHSHGLRALLATCFCIIAITCTCLIATGIRSHNQRITEYTAGIHAVPERTRILAIHYHPDRHTTFSQDDVFDPISRADSYYCLEKGGATQRCLARNNTVYVVWYKRHETFPHHPDFPDVKPEAQHPDALDKVAAAYGCILLWEERESELRSKFLMRGFHVAFRNGRLTVLVSD